MKRAAVILITILYLLPVIGMTVSAHYCCGKLSSVSLNFLGKGKCPCGTKKMKKNCCKTKTCLLSIKDVQQNSPQLAIDFSKSFSFVPCVITTNPVVLHSTTFLIPFCNNLPLPKIKQPLYLSNKVFRI